MVRSSNHMPTTAIVLAGGLGTRLRSAVADTPKVLAPVAGKPFLAYVLMHLVSQGMEQAILCTGYLSEQVKSFAGDGRQWGLKIQYSEEFEPLGTGGAIRQASHSLNYPFFALNGDTLFQADFKELWLAHQSIGAMATLALLRVESGEQRGCVSLDATGKIVAFEEKPLVARQVLINAGSYLLDPLALASIRSGESASMERDIFPELAASGQLAGHVQKGFFADIGTPASLAAFEKKVLAGNIRFD